MTLSINTRNCSVSVDARDESTMVIALQMCAVGIPELTEKTFDLFRLRRLCLFARGTEINEDDDSLMKFMGMKVNAEEKDEAQFAMQVYRSIRDKVAPGYDLQDLNIALCAQEMEWKAIPVLTVANEEDSNLRAYEGLKWRGHPDLDLNQK